MFCGPCWVDLYAPSCVVCGSKIDGDRINCGDGTYRHPACGKPRPSTKKASSVRRKKVGPRVLAGLYAGADAGELGR